MLRRFALWRARECDRTAGLCLLAASTAAVDGDSESYRHFIRDADEALAQRARWRRIADWRRELRALLFDDPEPEELSDVDLDDQETWGNGS